MKKNVQIIKAVIAMALMFVLTVSMVACAGAAADPTETTGELLAVVTEATQPEKEAFVSSSRYQATLPPEPEKPAATQPAETETEPANPGNGETAGNGNTTADPAPVAPVDPAPVEPAPTEPTPTETAPPATEAPATVSFDYNAAAAYGNSYAASTYGWIVDSSVDSFYPASSVDVQYAIDNGGQSYINTRMASVVDSTYSNLAALGNTMFGVWCDCFESDGWIYFVVYYG